ncbi:uncharacterized protein LOC142338674 [Convolutriloba macropyga]|uniref:uncharacterized protein LOC142338674 n=1 Tax=Convolutriloba macropyga TaxID=536237 RepID=UPI003F51C856
MGEWSYTLFGCFDSFKTCILALFCPCYVAGKVAESVGENCILHGLCCAYNAYCRAAVRQKVRLAKGIDRVESGDALHQMTYLWDLVAVDVCYFCALCQEYNEMQIARS